MNGDSEVGAASTRRLGWAVWLAGVVAALWSLGFAAVSAWQLVTGPGERSRLSDYAAGLAVMIVLVLALKLVGAVLALAAVLPGRLGLSISVVAIGLWGAFGLVGLYAVGGVFIAVGTVGGVLQPSEAWIAAGGVTERSALYLLFVSVGAAAYGGLAISFHRRYHQPWKVAAEGLVGAPLLLLLLLGVAPGILGVVGLLPR